MQSCKAYRYWLAVVGIWLAIVLVGFWQLHTYSSQAGVAGAAPQRLTSDSQAEDTGPRLVFFAHPHCPCTRASLVELATILERSPPELAVEIHFVRPPGVAAGWEQTANWKAATKLPGVRVCGDEGGVLAGRLGAATSGHAVRYGPGGELLFQGGLTRGRGQVGDSSARRAILALLAGQPAAAQSPVFGCSLLTPGQGDLSACCSSEGAPCQSCR